MAGDSMKVKATAPQLGLEPAAVGVVLRQVPEVQSKVPGLEVGAENIVGPSQATRGAPRACLRYVARCS